jgi:N,N'-diacetyllegionaminate synthase
MGQGSKREATKMDRSPLGLRVNGGCFIVAEVAQGHEGSLGMAHSYIDAVANAGADAVKFQTHIAAAESTPAEPWRVPFSLQDATRYAYWKRMEFTEEQWRSLKSHAIDRGISFLSSPFSVEAVELLASIGVPYWKIASGEVNNTIMFERIMATRLPILMSTGMSSLEEIDAAVALIKRHDIPLGILQCTSLYPCPAEKIGLNLIPFFRERYQCSVGLSDHSGTIYSGLAAATIGIDVLEVHVTFSREMFGPDVPSSLTINEFRQLTDGIRFIEKMKEHPIDKNEMAQDLLPMRSLFTKSVVTQVGLPAGTVIRREHLAVKKPGTGIPAKRLPELTGRTLRRSVEADHLLQESDLI